MKTLPELEYEDRLRRESRCTLRSPALIGGLIIVGVTLLLMFSAPYLPGGSRSGFSEDVYAPDFPY